MLKLNERSSWVRFEVFVSTIENSVKIQQPPYLTDILLERFLLVTKFFVTDPDNRNLEVSL